MFCVIQDMQLLRPLLLYSHIHSSLKELGITLNFRMTVDDMISLVCLVDSTALRGFYLAYLICIPVSQQLD